MPFEIPNSVVFEAHGLHDIEVDLVGEWVSGWATLKREPNYPLFVTDPVDIPERCRFSWCSLDEPGNAHRFRRRAQIITLDSLPPPPSSRPSTPSETPSPPISLRHNRRRNILAWWEDTDGLWFLTDEEKVVQIGLIEWWSKRVAERPTIPPEGDNVHNHVSAADQLEAREPSDDPRDAFAEGCEILVGMARSLHSLHEKNLINITSRTTSFAVVIGDTTKVEMVQHLDAMPLPGFSLAKLLDGTPYNDSTLFSTDPLEPPMADLTVEFISRNLRFLSPDAVTSRRVNPQSDIYSFGVCAYELLTGVTVDGGPDTPGIQDIDWLIDIQRHLLIQIVPPIVCLEREAALGQIRPKLPPQQLSDIIMKCLAKDLDERYASREALIYDLQKLAQICKSRGDLSKFKVGVVDKASRFFLPKGLVHREQEIKELHSAMESILRVIDHDDHRGAPVSTKVVNLWGLSGSGKSQVMLEWAGKAEKSRKGREYLVGYAKLDEHIRNPLSSFSQILQTLVERVFTDPYEDRGKWQEIIKTAVGTKIDLFLHLLNQSTRRLLSMTDVKPAEAADWENFLPAFKSLTKKLLQAFATQSRPLILCVDDIQWMTEDEIHIWRYLLEVDPLIHVFLVSVFRVEVDEPPPISLLLSASSTNVHISRLDEDGVEEFVDACFGGQLENAQSLSSFLFAETQGSPLYMRTLMSALVNDKAVFFDFDRLIWRFDSLLLQNHLTDISNVDAYLNRLMSALPSEVQTVLKTMSCVPSSGLSAQLLSEFLNQPLTAVKASIQDAVQAGCIVLYRLDIVKFSHDRVRTAARNLIPRNDMAPLLHKLSTFLCRQDLRDEYVFVAADLALAARELDVSVEPSQEYVPLMLDAASRSALSASFEAAARFLEAADAVIRQNGGLTKWFDGNREVVLYYLRLSMEVYSVLKDFGAVDEKLLSVLKLNLSAVELIKVTTLRIRLMVWSNRHSEAMDLLIALLCSLGYDPDGPENVERFVPASVDDVRELQRHLKDEPVDEDDVCCLLMSLLCFAGPTIFVALPEKRVSIFILGISLVRKLAKVHDVSSYLVAVHAVTVAEIPIQEALCDLVFHLTSLRPHCLPSGSALVVIGAQVHRWAPLHHVESVLTPAFESTVTNGNYELAAYVMVIDMAARLFSSKPVDWSIIARRRESIRRYVSSSMRILMDMPLQYAENLASMPANSTPWDLLGAFLCQEDRKGIEGLAWHEGIWNCLSLRLAILYDAPLATQLAILESGDPYAGALAGTSYGVERNFLGAMVLIRTAHDKGRLEDMLADIRRHHRSINYRHRLTVLEAMIDLHRNGMRALSDVDEVLDRLDKDQPGMAALLHWQAGSYVAETSRSKKLGIGYVLAAYTNFQASGRSGVCQMIRQRYPMITFDVSVVSKSPSSFLRTAPPPPPLRPSSNSVSAHTVTTTTTSASSLPTTDGPREGEGADDALDTLTLMRSSLALASEQDPSVLLCSLLRILCQFARADYAAIGLYDPDDPSTVFLRAAGQYDRILPYDLNITDEACQTLCPASLMLQVCRTGKNLTKISFSARLRYDSFYGDRYPRMLICTPILNQGKQAGVILLSSMMTENSRAHSSSGREIIHCLATFAIIATLNHSFTRRLKREVDQRTKQLSDALQAKTQFLSQCSHELRSPLSAVLGLAAVLEASSGLTEVQREHLRTIISSGESLLSLINNILDHSRLESNSVTLERIKFSLREVVEDALDTVAPMAQNKGIEVCFTSSFKTDPPGLIGDPFRIKQILINLLSNGVKFTSKGKVTVSWHHEAVGDKQIKVSLDVEDTGIGIPQTKMEKLFRSFSQVDESITRSFGGSGLGLIISRDLARLLGGDCTATSQYGKGSTFTVTFVAEVDSAPAPTYEVFKDPRSAFIICPTGPGWQMLEENLTALNCQPVRFAAEVGKSLERDFPDGLNSKRNFHLILVDTELVTKADLAEMRRLQPKSKFIHLVRSIDLAGSMTKYDISRDSIVARPIKFLSLYNALIPAGNEDTPDRPKMTRTKKSRKINKDLAQTHPLEILLVDDNAVNRTVGKRILEMYGYNKVVTANDGQQGLDAAEKTSYDLVLMDLQMPVMDGFTAQKRIQASPLAGDPCVVALTANADVSTQQECAAAGFFTYMSKPLDIEKLGTVLQSVHAHRHKRNEEADGIGDEVQGEKKNQPGLEGEGEAIRKDNQ